MVPEVTGKLNPIVWKSPPPAALTPTSAIHIANEASFYDPGYSAVAREAEYMLIELRLEHGEQQASVKLSRAMTAVMFEDACRRGWAFLKGELERIAKTEKLAERYFTFQTPEDYDLEHKR